MKYTKERASAPGRGRGRLGSAWANALGAVAALCVVSCSGDDGGGSGTLTATLTGGPTTSSTGGGATVASATDPTTGSSSGGDETSTETGVVTPPPPPDFPPLPPVFCGLADLDPLADPAAVIDAGDGPGQLPPVIGDALLRNCGCHYSDDIPAVAVDYFDDGPVPISTHADFHVPFAGFFPANFDGLVYEAVELRVVFSDPLPMPSIECDVEGEEGTITEADRTIFADWLAAGAPDAPNYAQR